MPSGFFQWKKRKRSSWDIVGDYVVPAAATLGAAAGTYYAGKYTADLIGNSLASAAGAIGNAGAAVGEAANDYYFNPEAQNIASNLTLSAEQASRSFVPSTGIDDAPLASQALDLDPTMSGKNGYLPDPSSSGTANIGSSYDLYDDDEDLGGACSIQ